MGTQLVTTNSGSQNLKIESARKYMELTKNICQWKLGTLTTGRDQRFNKLALQKISGKIKE
jgi:hypothetical protein